MQKLIEKILKTDKPFFISKKDGQISIHLGEIQTHEFLDDLNIPKLEKINNKNSLSISMIPYSQIRERGFEAVDDGSKIITLTPNESQFLSEEEFFNLQSFDESITTTRELQFNFTDAEFEQIVSDVVEEEIKNGSGSNFMLSRKIMGSVKDMNVRKALTVFSRLCENEASAYTTFCFFDGEKYFIGASPERHLSVIDNIAIMNPICGTLPKNQDDLEKALLDFVKDEKEINELFMVVDETLKMMMPICPTGGEVIGPYLREMRTVIHTENELRGKTDWSLVDAFRQTMFAPTMVGSPIESASKVINKHEKGQGRGYYASALMTLEKDPLGQDVSLDSTITIRMVEITKEGKFTIQAGSSIVRDSDPKKEAIEARQKAEGLLKALNSSFKDEPVLDGVINKEVMDSLLARNSRISPFWIKDQSLKDYPKVLKGKSIFMINNEDDFAHMAAHFLRHMGATVSVHDIAKLGKTLAGINNYDLIILGPGPGDPNDLNDPKVQKLRSIASTLLNSEGNQKFFGICLGHQIICAELGMKLEKLPFPQQGVQSKVRLFDRDYDLGFYNTFAGRLEGLQLGSDFNIATDQSGFVNGVRGKDFTSLQSHPESILSKDGYDLLYIEVPRLLNG